MSRSSAFSAPKRQRNTEADAWALIDYHVVRGGIVEVSDVRIARDLNFINSRGNGDAEYVKELKRYIHEHSETKFSGWNINYRDVNGPSRLTDAMDTLGNYAHVAATINGLALRLRQHEYERGRMHTILDDIVKQAAQQVPIDDHLMHWAMKAQVELETFGKPQATTIAELVEAVQAHA